MEQIRLAIAFADGTYRVWSETATVAHVKMAAAVTEGLGGKAGRVVLVKIEELPDSASEKP